MTEEVEKMLIEKNVPPFDVTKKMSDFVTDISEQVKKIRDNYSDLEKRPHLRRNNRIRSVYSSLAVEANSLSPAEVRAVIDGKTVLGPQREIREVQNAYRAYEMIGEFNPYSIQDFKKLHGVMTEMLIEESGKFRRGEEGVFDGSKCIFMAPPARLVNELTENLFDWLNNSRNKINPLIASSVFHYELVFIHPFSDGNGRMARLWQTALLSDKNDFFQYLPLESQIQKFQAEYYKAIADSHKTGKSNIFVEFMLEKIFETLTEVLRTLPDFGSNDDDVTVTIKPLKRPIVKNTSPDKGCGGR